MSTPLSRDIGDQLGRIGRHWGWLLFFGVLMVVVGIIALAWPGPTVIALAVLFGIQIIVSGIFSFINAFAADESGGMRVWNVILGLLGIVIGLYAVRHINWTNPLFIPGVTEHTSPTDPFPIKQQKLIRFSAATGLWTEFGSLINGRPGH